jgi:hypothetical protein
MSDLRETRHVAASPTAVYDLVADLPRMGEWSPECERVQWRGGATGAVKGAKFIGWNRAGAVRWFTYGEVVAADRGRNLAFEVTVGPVKVARWEYFIVPDDEGLGCTIIEEWTDRRGQFGGLMDRALGTRRKLNAAGISATLDALKRAAESERVA